MGDRGRHSTYVVKAGDSPAKVAKMLYGDERAYGEILRANGYRAWQPGDVIKLPGARKDGNYFVSAKDVNYAQNSTNANYKGPVMQQAGDYKANYAAAQAAGQPGVYGQQNFTGTGANAGGGAAVASNVNYSPTSPAPLSLQPSTASGQAAAQQWQAGQTQRTNQAAVDKAAAIERGLVGTSKPGTPTPAGFVTSTAMTPAPSMAGSSFSPSPGVAAGIARPTPAVQAAPQQQNKVTTPTPAGVTPSQLQQQQDALAAVQIAQGLPTIGGPSYMTLGQSRAIMEIAMADTSGKLLQKIMDTYEFGIDGALRAKGTRYAPGSQVTALNPFPALNDSSYSNTPPQGYNSGDRYGRGGRRGGGGGGGSRYNGRRYQNDYGLRLGQ